jgi:two-component system alkaline phosphatase synthesis response regulator PhoP
MENILMCKKVLIVDDEENVLELLYINIIRRGYKVETARDGEEALEKMKHFTPDIVLLDIKLPGIDGWEVCRKIKSDPKTEKTGIIILSALTQKEDLENANKCGATVFMPKPFDVAALLAAINETTINDH